jgi:phenylphosphate carboxylase alpha subunit
MGFKDNREYIKALEKTGDVVTIKQQIDWDVELGAIIRRGCELRAPAILCENIKDYPGWKIFGSPAATYRRFAICMGLKPESSVKEIYEEYGKRMTKGIPPVMVKDAPCKENIFMGDKVDLFDLPAPIAHDGDGGRYVGLWAFEVTKDLSSDWQNWGIYRVMIYDRKTLAGQFLPSKHIGVHMAKYFGQKKPMPIAIVIGPDPVSGMVAQFPVEAGQNEADFAGSLGQQAIELIKCETNDLLVPANAEIIIEGEVLPDKMVPEGPYGEYTGYRSGLKMQNVIKVNAITHRDNPIFTVSNMGIPPHEGDHAAIARGWQYERFLKSLGIPVTHAFVPPEFAIMTVVVGVKVTHANMANRVKNAIMASRPAGINKIFVVEDDVDVFNLNEVLHAFATKCHPIKGIRATEEYITGLVPWLTPQERRLGKGAAVLFDCTWPTDYPKEAIPPKIAFSTYPPEVQKKVLDNWSSYGFH